MTNQHTIEQTQYTDTFAKPVNVTDHCFDHQTCARLHHEGSLLIMNRSSLSPLAKQARIRNDARFLRFVAAPLPLPVGPDIATAAGCRIIRTVLEPEAIMASLCLDQRAIGQRVFYGQQPLLVGQAHDFCKERFDHFVLKQTIPVLREHRVVLGGVFD